MKNYKKTITMLLTAAVLLIAVFMTGCTKLSEAPNSTPSEVAAPAESDGFGVYVKLERDDASSIALHGGSSFTKVCENADGSLLKAGEWVFTGDDIVQLSRKKTAPSSLPLVRMTLTIRFWAKAPSSTMWHKKSCMSRSLRTA